MFKISMVHILEIIKLSVTEIDNVLKNKQNLQDLLRMLKRVYSQVAKILKLLFPPS